jgi:hypothetical protein
LRRWPNERGPSSMTGTSSALSALHPSSTSSPARASGPGSRSPSDALNSPGR